MNKKNKMILVTCTVVVLVFGGLFVANSELFKGYLYSSSERSNNFVSKKYCLQLRNKVNKLEVGGLDVNSNTSYKERNNIYSCSALLGDYFLDDLGPKCKSLQKNIIRLISSGMPVTGNLSQYQQNLTNTCNINSEYGSPNYVQYVKKPYRYSNIVITSNKNSSKSTDSSYTNYCVQLRDQVDKLESLGKDVTTNITTKERNNIYSCSALLGDYFLDDLGLKCKSLQKYIIRLISSGMPVTGNLSQYQQNLTNTCNINDPDSVKYTLNP